MIHMTVDYSCDTVYEIGTGDVCAHYIMHRLITILQ